MHAFNTIYIVILEILAKYRYIYNIYTDIVSIT